MILRLNDLLVGSTLEILPNDNQQKDRKINSFSTKSIFTGNQNDKWWLYLCRWYIHVYFLRSVILPTAPLRTKTYSGTM